MRWGYIILLICHILSTIEGVETESASATCTYEVMGNHVINLDQSLANGAVLIGGNHQNSIEECQSACCSQNFTDATKESDRCNLVTYYDYEDADKENCFFIKCQPLKTCTYKRAEGFSVVRLPSYHSPKLTFDTIHQLASSNPLALDKLSLLHPPASLIQLLFQKSHDSSLPLLERNKRRAKKTEAPETTTDNVLEKEIVLTPAHNSTETPSEEKGSISTKKPEEKTEKQSTQKLEQEPTEKPAQELTEHPQQDPTEGQEPTEAQDQEPTEGKDQEPADQPSSVEPAVDITEKTEDRNTEGATQSEQVDQPISSPESSITNPVPSSTDAQAPSSIDPENVSIVTKAAPLTSISKEAEGSTNSHITPTKATPTELKEDTSGKSTEQTTPKPEETSAAKNNTEENIIKTPSSVKSGEENTYTGTEDVILITVLEAFSVTDGNGAVVNDTGDIYKFSLDGTNGILVVSLALGTILMLIVMGLLGRRWYEAYQRRHYNKVNYLINGMYN